MLPGRGIVLWLLALAAMPGVAAAQPGGGPPPANVRIDTVRRVEQRREVLGELRAVKRSYLAAEEPGLVVQLSVDVGDWVQQGQAIARLDDRRRALDLERDRAERAANEAVVTEREAQVEKAERDLRRLEELGRREGASRNEIDDARTTLKAAEARLAQARADLASARADEAMAEKRLADMTIRAPFSGAVVSKSTEVGQWVREGEALVEIVAIDEVDAFLDVPERFVRSVASPGVVIEVRVPAVGRSIPARVSSVLAAGDRLGRTFPVRLRIDNTASGGGEGRLLPGMSVAALVPTGEPADMLTVHKDAVLRNDAGAFVYFNAGGVAAVAPVESLFAQGDRVVVRSPALSPGVSVITDGNERIFPGQPLNILDGAAGGG
jgi:RND family efflux transporter MFP subunit